jgi:hypothetical protein
MAKKYKVRKPNEEEMVLIADFLAENADDFAVDFKVMSEILGIENADELKEGEKVACCLRLLQDYYIVVLEGYQSDCPSYVGTIFTIVWGECCFQTSLIYNSDKTALIENILQ